MVSKWIYFYIIDEICARVRFLMQVTKGTQ
jgi:hypothetical protein